MLGYIAQEQREHLDLGALNEHDTLFPLSEMVFVQDPGFSLD